ncbi:MAG: hypothetical protein KC431_03570, partial [Myxococcales bacterium]|nr:hypothetical protein [Myxococcales bacterium]
RSIPQAWKWSEADLAAQAARTQQVDRQMQAMTPPRPISGTTAQQIKWRYSARMWSEEVFEPAQLERLFVWLDDDAEFARQRLGSANTNVIRSATSFDVEAWISSSANADKLDRLRLRMLRAQANAELFVCDYRPVLGSVVQSCYVRHGGALAAPVCFFVVRDDELEPIAIQIEATNPHSYIFTPTDEADERGDAWLLAKLWVANADQTWWFSGSHLFNTHSIDMIFGIAALNQLASGPLTESHPMLMLARPHLVKVFDINNAVYSMPTPYLSDGDKAYAGGGIYQVDQFCDRVLPTGRIGIYEIIDNLYRDYDFAGSALLSNMAERGLLDGPIAKVSFPYRDDAKVWWPAVEGLVRGVVEASYADDAAVAADLALGGWMKLVETAFNQNQAQGPRFVWTATKAGLVEVFTNLIFLCSVQHCSVNNSMFNSWAFTPNGPFSMQKAPPRDAASVSQALVLATLPDPTKVGNDGSTSLATDMELIRNQVTFVMNGTAEVPELLAGDGSRESLYAAYPYPEGSPQRAAVDVFYVSVWLGSGSVKARITANQRERIEAYFRGREPGVIPNSVSYYYLSVDAVGGMFLNAATTQAIQI